MFPAVDPIPLPAPVWLFKALHIVTLALHFCAVHLMLGGLLLATGWALIRKKGQPGDEALADASGAVVYRLPVLMTYVINFGVPPLLFTQVLYGRAIYTSSVLIGVWWFAIIGILTLAYWLLYRIADRAQNRIAWGWVGLVTLLLLTKISAIYTNNFTLMLRPDLWQELYRNNPTGSQLPSGDPTTLPRLLYMFAASVAITGATLPLLATKQTLRDGARGFLRSAGGFAMIAGAAAMLAIGFWTFKSQPEAVKQGLVDNKFYLVFVVLWGATTALLAALGGLLGPAKKLATTAGAIVAAVVAFLNVASLTVVRDGIRDLSLMRFGYDVWERSVVTNWSVVGIFLFLFVVMLGIIGWLISVVVVARKEQEQYA